MERRRLWIALAWLVVCAGFARGDDAYFRVMHDDLAKMVDGKLPELPAGYTENWWTGNRADFVRPYVALDRLGEAYVLSQSELAWLGTTVPNGSTDETSLGAMFVRAPAGKDVAGRLFVPKRDLSGMIEIKFKIAAAESKDKYGHDFFQAKALHYDRLVNDGVPGGAWFRHEARKAREALGEKLGDLNTGRPNPNGPIVNRGSVEDTYELFSGGRALSENLQLDRTLPAAKRDVPTIDANSLEGITIATIDWKKYLKADAHPQLDPLAAAIPEDQHAVFFASFPKLLEVIDRADRQGTTVLQFATPRSEDARVRSRYERQLCLSASALSRLLGPALVKSVAVTGSDPYFPTGTDVAVLFEAAQPAALRTLLVARVMQAGTAADPEARPYSAMVGTGDDAVPYAGMASADRSVCSFVARLGNVVAVTNSSAQLERLAEVHQGKRPALAGLQEFQYFRTRYPLGAADESALLFLSDPTIRRWCGPKWRIASSRRTLGMHTMDDLQADFFESLASGHVEAGPIHADNIAIDLGNLRLTASGVRSSTLGTLEFQTPIIELPWDKVTKAEADGYKRWRDNYQNNWRWAFDPIALRIHCGEKSLAGDLTVMPLIFASEYHELVELSRGAKLAPTAGDPHDAPIQFVMGINHDALPMRSAGNLLQGAIPGQTDPLSWIGSSIGMWVEDDPFWDELARKKDDQERWKFFEENVARLPVAVQIDVSSRIKLTAFLVALRGMIEQTAPGMVAWESLKYHDQAYVKLTPTERAKKELPPGVKEPCLFYAILPDGLLLTLNQRLLEQAIDRQAAREKAQADGKPIAAPAHPWLGASECLQFNQKAVTMLAELGREAYRTQMQRLAWSNLPILNEWKRRYPDRDPVALHEQFWQTRLVCPGGGKYVWNEKWQTMESTVYGNPGQPKTGPSIPPALAELLHANFGLSFEDQGLRARLELEQAAADSDKGR
jgi:hypothetical protein